MSKAKDRLNEQLKDVANKMATIEARVERGEAKSDEVDAYKSLVADGTKLREQMDVLEAGEALKSWMGTPDGESAARKSFSQEVTSPEDREQEQRAQDKSATKAYAGAFESYLIRGENRIGPNDHKLLKEGAIKAQAMKVITEGSAQGGGYLVPEQYMAEVLKKSPGLVGLNDNVRSQPTTRDVVCWPIVRYSTSNRYTAPHRLTFTGEIPASATAHRVTDQTFGEVRIPVNIAMASQLISNSLIEDSATDVMALTAQLFNENIMQDVEDYVCNGTGAGQPEGMFANGLLRANYIANGQATLAITTAGINSIYWRLPAQYRRNAKWLMNSLTALQVASITDVNGRFMWQASDMFGGGLGSVQQDGSVVTQPKLLGMPLVISEACPNVTTGSFPLAFGDFKGYIRADRIGMTVRVLDEIYAETDQKLYLLRYRFGGQVAEDYKINLLSARA